MDQELQQAYQQVAKYQANVSYLHGILNLIKEAMLVSSGKELKAKISELIENGLKHTPVA